MQQLNKKTVNLPQRIVGTRILRNPTQAQPVIKPKPNGQNAELRRLVERITVELKLDTEKIDLDLLTAYISMRLTENLQKQQLSL